MSNCRIKYLQHTDSHTFVHSPESFINIKSNILISIYLIFRLSLTIVFSTTPILYVKRNSFSPHIKFFHYNLFDMSAASNKDNFLLVTKK